MSGLHAGSFRTEEVRGWFPPQAATKILHPFPKPYHTEPGICMGLNQLDLGQQSPIQANCYPSGITRKSMTVHIDNYDDGTLYGGGCAWQEITNPSIQFGTYTLSDDEDRLPFQASNTTRITFDSMFEATPVVLAFFSGLNLAQDKPWQLATTVDSIDAGGFTLHVDTPVDQLLTDATVSWLAYPRNNGRIASGMANTVGERPLPTRNSGRVDFPSTVFTHAPKAQVFINSLDVDPARNLRLRVEPTDVSVTGMRWNADTWYDTILNSVGITYIAFE